MKLIIIDGNNWFRRRIETDPMGSPVKSCFYEIQNQPNDTVIFLVWDGYGALKMRREIYPDYKVHRKPAGENIYASQDLFKKVALLGKAISIEVPGFEGDDVIAFLARKYGPRFQEVFIESNDLDLYQLGYPMARQKYPEIPKNIAIYKTMVGDSSDNIPGCKGFGEKSWFDLQQNQKDMLAQIIISGYDRLSDKEVQAKVDDFFPNRAKKFFYEKENRLLLNKFYKLITFKAVPEKLVDEHTKKGLNRPDLTNPIFEEYML